MGSKDQKKRKAASANEEESSVEGHVSDSNDNCSLDLKGYDKCSKSRTRKHESADDDASETIPTVKKPKLGITVHRNAEGEGYIDIGKKRRATVRSFKGTPLIDIREYYGPDGDEKPGKKGISLSVDQWEAVKDNFDLIDQLLSDLKQ